MIHFIRVLFLLLVSAVAVTYTLRTANDAVQGDTAPITYFVMVGGVVAAFAAITVDLLLKKKNLSVLSGLFFGLLVGLVVSLALGYLVDQLVNVFVGEALTTPSAALIVPNRILPSLTQPGGMGRPPLPPFITDPGQQPWQKLIEGCKLLMGLMTTYLTVSFVLQTKDDFRFIIPYVEFTRATKGPRPLVVDTSVIIDGRIADLAGTGIFESRLLVPRFVLNELQAIADSGDRLKRSRGRRGLDVLQRLQANPKLDLHIWDGSLASQPDGGGEGVDQKLVALAQQENGRVVTNDFNLLKVAQLRGVEVINLNAIADALKPVVLPGETMVVRIVKPGEGPTQGVGYLEDGTMVVVDGGRDKVGTEVEVVVTNALQTAAGKMIFGRVEGKAKAGS